MAEQISDLAAAGRAARNAPGPHARARYRPGPTGAETALRVIGVFMCGSGVLMCLGGMFLVLAELAPPLVGLAVGVAGVYTACASAFVCALGHILRHLRTMEDLLWRTLEQGAKP